MNMDAHEVSESIKKEIESYKDSIRESCEILNEGIFENKIEDDFLKVIEIKDGKFIL